MIDESRLSNFRIFDGLSDAHRTELARLCERVEVTAGETIMRQGDPGDDFYLIESGEFDVVREDGGNTFVLNQVGAGQHVGLLALIDEEPRKATLRANRPSVVYRLTFAALRELYGDHHDQPYAILMRNEVRQTSQFLTDVNAKTVESLKRQLAQSKKRLSFGSFVAFLIGSVTLYAFLLRVMLEGFMGRWDSTWITAGILLACMAIYIPMMRRSGFPLSTYGINLHNWKHGLWESFWWTGAFLAVVIVVKMIALQVVPDWKGAPLFSMYGFTRYDKLTEALSLMGIYALFVPVQELIARGAMQSSLHEFLAGKNATLWAILLSTLMFGQIHLHLNVGYAVSAFIPSLFWGALYARQRSLLGVTVSHIIIGIFIAFFLGLPTMEHAG